MRDKRSAVTALTDETSVIHRSLIRTRHPDRQNAVCYWHATVTRRDGRKTRFEASADQMAVRWSVGEHLGWELGPFSNHRPGRNCLALTVDDSRRKAVFERDVILADRYIGLGPYLLSQLVLAARAVCPECSIQATLSLADAADPLLRDTRNRFYEKFNFTLEFPEDPERRYGFVSCERLEKLTPHWGSERNPVEVIEDVGLLQELAQWEMRAIDAERKVAGLTSQSKDLAPNLWRASREASRWRLACLLLVVSVLLYAVLW